MTKQFIIAVSNTSLTRDYKTLVVVTSLCTPTRHKICCKVSTLMLTQQKENYTKHKCEWVLRRRVYITWHLHWENVCKFAGSPVCWQGRIEGRNFPGSTQLCCINGHDWSINLDDGINGYHSPATHSCTVNSDKACQMLAAISIQWIQAVNNSTGCLCHQTVVYPSRAAGL